MSPTAAAVAKVVKPGMKLTEVGSNVDDTVLLADSCIFVFLYSASFTGTIFLN